MIAAGVFTDDDPVELLEGVLVYKMPKNPSHRMVARLLADAIAKLLPPGWHVQSQEPVTLPDGEPEPDVAVVRGSPRDYATRHPAPEEVPLVVEVADSTLARDRGIKLRSYARAGIQQYWIVDLASQSLELFTQPDASGPRPSYGGRAVLGAADNVVLSIGGKDLGEIAISSFLS